jgi:NADP-dependent 3-hydroxy acid dehydrogenase YdfG
MHSDAKAASAPVVLLTGAGSGLGAAMARRFARAGFQVAVTDINADRAQQVSEQLSSSGASSLYARLDISCDEDWQRVAAQVEQEWGRVNVLVNNAGVAAAGLCEETSLQDWQWIIDIDLMGVVRGCHRFLPGLRQEGAAGRPAHVINIASFAGFSAMPGLSAYGTAKAGVIALSEHLLTELDGSGVGVSVVCPSFFATNLLESFRSAQDDTRQTVERWMKHSPLSADDVAEIVFKAMQKKQFMVLTHPKTLWPWRMKRFWPSRYYRRISGFARQAQSKKTGNKTRHTQRGSNGQ